jgi:hypothetical protein
VKPRFFFLPIASLMVALILWTAAADGHRLSGHPKTVEAKLKLAKKQVRHDRRALASLHRRGWTLIRPLDFALISHRVWLRQDITYVRRLQQRVRPDVLAIICQVFGPYCAEAQRVALCEGGRPVPSVRARNGQYEGIFQMGSFARSRYGHGWDAWSQARAAYRYFIASGRDWSPWECRP